MLQTFLPPPSQFRLAKCLERDTTPNSWIDHMGRYSPENQQKIHVHARVVWTLAETWTPDIGLGLTKKVVTVTSKVKGFLPTWKIDLEKADIYSKAPVEGGPKVAELSKDLVDSKRLIDALKINLNY